MTRFSGACVLSGDAGLHALWLLTTFSRAPLLRSPSPSLPPFQIFLDGRAHANAYLPILPEKNHVASLLKGFPANAKHQEVYAYRKLEQPATIQGGTMKDYQVGL